MPAWKITVWRLKLSNPREYWKICLNQTTKRISQMDDILTIAQVEG